MPKGQHIIFLLLSGNKRAVVRIEAVRSRLRIKRDTHVSFSQSCTIALCTYERQSNTHPHFSGVGLTEVRAIHGLSSALFTKYTSPPSQSVVWMARVSALCFAGGLCLHYGCVGCVCGVSVYLCGAQFSLFIPFPFFLFLFVSAEQTF